MNLNFHFTHRLLWAVSTLLCVVIARPGGAARACTIAMPLPTLADHAGQVFVGTVTHTRSFWTDDTPRTIVTEVVFDSVTYWKGAPASKGDQFRLIVPGGSVDGLELRLCCGPQYVVGQRWVMFLLPEYRTYPVVGIDQGAFRVETTADGIEYVATSGGVPLTGVSDAGLPIASHAITGRAPRAYSPGMRIQESQADPSAVPMSLAEFESHLAPILTASRDHGLSEPAGRRVAVTYRGVAIVERAGHGAARELSDRLGRSLDTVHEIDGDAAGTGRTEGGR